MGYHKNWKSWKIIFRKNSEILVKYVQFFEIFLRKNGFFGQENFAIIEKWIHFQILWIVLKNENSPPRTPCGGGGVIAFKWPDRSPLPRKNPGDATAYIRMFDPPTCGYMIFHQIIIFKPEILIALIESYGCLLRNRMKQTQKVKNIL